MNVARYLLWIDGLGGIAVGVIVLFLCRWLSTLYALPATTVFLIGVVNLLYGCYSTSIASRKNRPESLIVSLALANISWLFVCIGMVAYYWQGISPIGATILLLEGVYVAALGCAEWNYRKQLLRV